MQGGAGGRRAVPGQEAKTSNFQGGGVFVVGGWGVCVWRGREGDAGETGLPQATILPPKHPHVSVGSQGTRGKSPLPPSPALLPSTSGPGREVWAAALGLQAWAGEVGCCGVELGRLPVSSDPTSPRSHSPGKENACLEAAGEGTRREPLGRCRKYPGTGTKALPSQAQPHPRRQSPRPFPPPAPLPGPRGSQMGGPRAEGAGGTGKRGEEGRLGWRARSERLAESGGLGRRKGGSDLGRRGSPPGNSHRAG